MYRRGRMGDSGRRHEDRNESVISQYGEYGTESTEMISDEETDLYRYNLPPKYDGSRFSRRITRREIGSEGSGGTAGREESVSAMYRDNAGGKEREFAEDERSIGSIYTGDSPYVSEGAYPDSLTEDSESCETRHADGTRSDIDGQQSPVSGTSLLSEFGKRLGSEELLLLAMMLAVADGGGEPCGDTLLFLALLLISS